MSSPLLFLLGRVLLLLAAVDTFFFVSVLLSSVGQPPAQPLPAGTVVVVHHSVASALFPFAPLVLLLALWGGGLHLVRRHRPANRA